MKTRLTPARLLIGGRRRPAVGLMTLLLGLGLAVENVQAIQSAPTGGRIHGRAPTATGNLTIRLPGGTTALTNNAQVNWLAKPSDFTLAPLTPGLTYTDADGDLPLGTGITLVNPPGVTWTWMRGSTPLTTAQLSQPFQSNFSNRTVLTVSASVPVNVTSLSGLPHSGIQTITTPTYNVVVRQILPPPIVYVNGATFPGNAGFPKTGFVGANFQFYMNGTDDSANGNYTYTTNQPDWTTVSSAGGVKFTQMPTATQKSVTITITDTTGGDVLRAYEFTPDLWFVNHRGGVADLADASCTGRYKSPSYKQLTNALKGNSAQRISGGGLWGEWGPMENYGNGWTNGPYWAEGFRGRNRNAVDFNDGRSFDYITSSGLSVLCSRSL